MTGKSSPRYLVAGESALVVEFGTAIDPAIHDEVLALDAAIGRAEIPGIIECVPTYRSLMIHFDPRKVSAEELAEALAQLDVTRHESAPRKRWHIPACYDEPFAEDIGEVARLLDLPEDKIISLHQGAVYRIYMYGFAPGFTFLGGLPPELSISRRAVPRPPAPPGALLIAGGQALIASCAMPTGWYALGRTPVRVFDLDRNPVSLAGIGDDLCFEPVDRATFAEMEAAAAAGAPVAWAD
jgi:inhibitor of KinA